VAEPNPARREAFAREHGISPGRVYDDWRPMLEGPQLGEACLVCTQDRMHTEPALRALERGYNVLLEKPMAVTLDDCRALATAAERFGRELRVCHVARYTSFFSRLKKAVADGMVGTLLHIAHSENVAFWHFPHGYVRGHWRRAGLSSPVILAKTCHDLDLLYWIAVVPADSIHSFGDLSFFRRENAPPGAPARCTDGCPHAADCLWYAPRLYVTGEQLVAISRRAPGMLTRFAGRMVLDHPGAVGKLGAVLPPLRSLVDWDRWPATVITDDLSREGKMKALREGPYGRCVFRCDNDVPDHQTVNIRFEGGLTAVMTMQGLSYLDGRHVRIDGSKGTLEGSFTYAGEKLSFFDHRRLKEHVLWKQNMTGTSHGEGDAGLMASFVNSLTGAGTGGAGEALTSARASLESHLMGFAAERSRLENRVVSMEEMRLSGPPRGRRPRGRS